MTSRPAPGLPLWRTHLASVKSLALSRLVPAAGAYVAAPDNVAVVGLPASPTGLGQSARLCRAALLDAGYHCDAIDLSERFKVAAGVPVETDAQHLRPGPGILIVHLNAPQTSRALWHLGPRLTRDKMIIGYWAWELEHVPTGWVEGARHVHEVWTPSHFSAQALSRAIDRPVRVVPHLVRDVPSPDDREGSSQAAARKTLGLPRSAFVVAFAFAMLSNFERKNPLAATAAFKQAFGADPGARLVLRCLDGGTYPDGLDRIRRETDGFDNISLHTDIDLSMATLMQATDVYLSLHRSEGFGLTLLEAMAAGRPVIATNWSGNTDFMTADDSVLIDANLISVRDPQGIYQLPEGVWADPDIDAAAAALRRLRADAEFRLTLGTRSRSQSSQFAARALASTRVALKACIQPSGDPLDQIGNAST